MRYSTGWRAGYIGLLMLVIAMAIGAVIYFIMIKAVLPDVGDERTQRVKVWDEEWRLDPCSPERLKEAKKSAKWLKVKPAIAEARTLEGEVKLGKDPRGNVTLTFSKDGKISGTWDAQYGYDNLSYEISAEFAGVTDPTKTFQEGDTVRPDLLYFITKGSYTQKSVDKKAARESAVQGTVYVAGWLDLAMTAKGEITLTTDKRGSTLYSFEAAAKE
jgi:hypothetical protein